MISNLESARSLVKADLEHARGVLDLWNRQVTELEKTLDQMESVGQSQVALRDQHTGVKAIGASLLTAEKAAQKGGKRGPKPKAAASVEPEVASTSKEERAPKKTAKAGKAKAAAAEKPARANAEKPAKAVRAKKSVAAKKRGGAPQPKFKDPNSDKTWAGQGRRPLWMTGDLQQYAIQPDSSAPAASTQADGAAAQA